MDFDDWSFPRLRDSVMGMPINRELGSVFVLLGGSNSAFSHVIKEILLQYMRQYKYLSLVKKIFYRSVQMDPLLD